MILVDIILVTLAGLTMWWLSGYDARVMGENKKADLIRRGIRCGLTILLLAILVSLPYSIASAPPTFLIAGLMTIIWAGSSRNWVRALSTVSLTPKTNANLTHTKALAYWIRLRACSKAGGMRKPRSCARRSKNPATPAFSCWKRCWRARASGGDFKKSKPLAVAHQLRSEGKFTEAETILQTLLAENPSNVDAALMLMRLYVRDLRRSDKAAEVLRSLEKQPHIPSAHIEYARRSIQAWGQRKSAPVSEVLPESVDGLLACGYLGTAIEILERKIKEQPKDFDLWLKLAEAHGLHSGNLQRAGKIVQQIESNRGFSAGTNPDCESQA